MSVEARFMAKVDTSISECWVWTAGRDRKGYGQFWFNGRTDAAHRVGFQLAGGVIPAGAQLDHLCRNPSCVNPSHLEPVSPRENLMRGETKAARQVAQTECVNGHPFDEANTYHWRGHRVCRACVAAASRRKRAKAREKVNYTGGI